MKTLAHSWPRKAYNTIIKNYYRPSSMSIKFQKFVLYENWVVGFKKS